MALVPQIVKQYHVFLASPGDTNEERKTVRQYFERYNRQTAQLWKVRFEVVDWENYVNVGVGRPQELITSQTLERFKDSLVLVVGIMGQRFGSPTGKAESGTEEEFRWALNWHKTMGFPEIKWFFKRVEQFVSPPDPSAVEETLLQWKKVRSFREELQTEGIFYAEYPDVGRFKEIFDNDLNRWITDSGRPWIPVTTEHEDRLSPAFSPPRAYYDSIERDFHRLDIAGIDNDRAFEIPLSEIYVRLRVMFDEESYTETDEVRDTGPIDIQTALLQFPKLVIVGDPGSGKSTFLKYIALMLARSVTANNPGIALEKLSLQEPLPIPVFVPCWDLSDFLKKRDTVQLTVLFDFLSDRMSANGFPIHVNDLQALFASGDCCLLIDGLDEVPTDTGRAAVSRLLEECVKRFDRNRYVVTSRVRAYTGDTILKGDFNRCDIQAFDVNDRAHFLENWVGLLFKIPPDQVHEEGTEASREFQSLTKGIELNDRIRPLALNPLLLTVIAIVHWNRKRLPEQRVDLYDECVDVLLGQRKEAERIQLSHKVGNLNEEQEQEQLEERAWLRKRFAEIALHILSGASNRDEAAKAEIVRLLAPRFVDRGATSQEQAETRATLFLERQELRSGLLVSRNEQSYRFVHLTFQEYLAAWHLANQEFDQIVPIIESRIRQQRWFETLQLLGCEWAKQSDEKLDRYLVWLLEHQGKSIAERAPVIALCANIFKDTTGVAELKPQTRNDFRSGVEGTLDAFRPGSGIPAFTQIEILEALGRLGGAVKVHLIDATKSGLFQVRRRAIEILLPHLSDDELFKMDHILQDRSKEPVKTYIVALVRRDPGRTATFLQSFPRFTERATEAFSELLYVLERIFGRDVLVPIARVFFEVGKSFRNDASRYYHEFQLWSWHYEPSYASRARLLFYIDDH